VWDPAGLPKVSCWPSISSQPRFYLPDTYVGRAIYTEWTFLCCQHASFTTRSLGCLELFYNSPLSILGHLSRGSRLPPDCSENHLTWVDSIRTALLVLQWNPLECLFIGLLTYIIIVHFIVYFDFQLASVFFPLFDQHSDQTHCFSNL
jgi:hypothetical protein